MLQKKKILYFVPEFPRLTETFIEREISKLIEFENLDITVFSMQKASGEMSPNVEAVTHYHRLTIGTVIAASFSYILLKPHIVLQAHKLITGKDKVPYLLHLKAGTNDPTIHTSVLGRFHKSRFIQFLKGIAYAKLFEKYQPSHIHVHFLSDTSTIAMVAAKILNVPFSVSAHAIDIFVEGSLITAKAREAKFIAICNEAAWTRAVQLANQEAKSGKIKLIFHGVDTGKVFGNYTPAPKPVKPFIFSVGRLVEKKGLSYLVEASKILKDRGISHSIKIAGAGPLYEQLRKLILDFGVGDSVEILGENKGVPNKEVIGHMLVADMFVLPNVESTAGDMDGVPTTVIEAALAKLPIVVTGAGSTTDLIVNEQTGVLIPQKSAVAIANAIEKLIFDEGLRARLGENAYIKAKEMFNIDRNVGELEKLLL